MLYILLWSIPCIILWIIGAIIIFKTRDIETALKVCFIGMIPLINIAMLFVLMATYISDVIEDLLEYKNK